MVMVSGTRHLKNYLQHVNSIFIVLYQRCLETEAVTKNKSKKQKTEKKRETDSSWVYGEDCAVGSPLELGQSVKLEFIVERLICVRLAEDNLKCHN